MFEVSEKDKKSKLEVLKEILELMDEQGTVSRLKSKKCPSPMGAEGDESTEEPSESDIESRLAEKAGESEPDSDSDDAEEPAEDDDEDFKRRLMEKLRGK